MLSALYADVFLMQVLDLQGTDLTLRFALAGFADQEMCATTVDVVADFSTDPQATAGPADVAFSVDGAALAFESASLAVTFDPTYTSVASASFEAQLFTEPLVPLIAGAGQPPDTVCLLASSLGGSCAVPHHGHQPELPPVACQQRARVLGARLVAGGADRRGHPGGSGLPLSEEGARRGAVRPHGNTGGGGAGGGSSVGVLLERGILGGAGALGCWGPGVARGAPTAHRLRAVSAYSSIWSKFMYR